MPRDPRHYPQETDLEESPTEEILRAHLCTCVYTHPSSVGGIRLAYLC